MNREEAIARAKGAVLEKLVATNVASFVDEDDEDSMRIAMHVGTGADARQLDVSRDGEAIWYVTLGLDSTTGDGDFTVTTRVTFDNAEVVDFEAKES